ncbi:MAG: hypothetical protein RLZZ232_2034 [Planctomycetota bacterium]|jgi:hypothetical protein
MAVIVRAITRPRCRCRAARGGMRSLNRNPGFPQSSRFAILIFPQISLRPLAEISSFFRNSPSRLPFPVFRSRKFSPMGTHEHLHFRETVRHRSPSSGNCVGRPTHAEFRRQSSDCSGSEDFDFCRAWAIPAVPRQDLSPAGNSRKSCRRSPGL